MQRIQYFKTQLHTFQLDMIHLVALAMIATGVLYPFYDRPDIPHPQAMIVIAGYIGFYAWSIMVTACGIGLLVKRDWVLFWLIPIYLFVLLMSQLSVTALLYYSSLLILTLYQAMAKPPTTVKLLGMLKPHQAAGVLHLLMAFGLIVHPHGVGMDYLYSAMTPILSGAITPVSFYQMLFLSTGIVLLSPYIDNIYARRFLMSPFIIHGLTFLFVIAFTTNAWSLAPFFMVITALWWDMGAYNGD